MKKFKYSIKACDKQGITVCACIIYARCWYFAYIKFVYTHKNTKYKYLNYSRFTI